MEKKEKEQAKKVSKPVAKKEETPKAEKATQGVEDTKEVEESKEVAPEKAPEVEQDFSKEKEEVIGMLDKTEEKIKEWDEKDPRHFSTHASILLSNLREYIQGV